MPKPVYWFPKQSGYVTDWSDTTGTIDTKLDGPFLEERSSFKMLGFSFSLKLDLGSCIQENWRLDLFNEVSFS